MVSQKVLSCSSWKFPYALDRKNFCWQALSGRLAMKLSLGSQYLLFQSQISVTKTLALTSCRIITHTNAIKWGAIEWQVGTVMTCLTKQCRLTAIQQWTTMIGGQWNETNKMRPAWQQRLNETMPSKNNQHVNEKWWYYIRLKRHYQLSKTEGELAVHKPGSNQCLKWAAHWECRVCSLRSASITFWVGCSWEDWDGLYLEVMWKKSCLFDFPPSLLEQVMAV